MCLGSQHSSPREGVHLTVLAEPAPGGAPGRGALGCSLLPALWMPVHISNLPCMPHCSPQRGGSRSLTDCTVGSWLRWLGIVTAWHVRPAEESRSFRGVLAHGTWLGTPAALKSMGREINGSPGMISPCTSPFPLLSPGLWGELSGSQGGK